MPNSFNFFLILMASLATGCAHSIQLAPDLDDLRMTAVSDPIDKNVGYYISVADRTAEVVTPGGGGDDVKYFPYKDTEAALNTMLSKVFTRVYSIPNLNDTAFFEEKNIRMIFIPTITTDSSSSSVVTWPATDFTFTLTCTVTDTSGRKIWAKTVSAQGKAEFDEFKHDHSLSARRASEEAYEDMLSKVLNADVLRE
jgi:hypothetical protein